MFRLSLTNPNTHCEPAGIPNVHGHFVISFGS